MRIKYEEKKAEKRFVEEQKRVEDQLVQFNMSNKEQLRETKENYKKIQNTDNKLINANQEARIKEKKEISKLHEDLDGIKRLMDISEKELQERRAEKLKLENELKQMSIYEHFLYKVMLVSEEQEKDEKPKEAIKKMIDRYERLKKKQRDLKLDLQEKEMKKKDKNEAMNIMKREMQNKIFKMNSEMHKTQKEIDELQKQLREIDIEIAEKVRMNQDKMIESAKIEMAVNNLYRMVIESKGKNVKDTSKAANQEQQPKMSLFEDITQKLEDIQDRMVELKWLFKAAKDPKEDAKVKKTT